MTLQDVNVICPGCGVPGMKAFYTVGNVPTNSVLLLTDQDEALAFLRGNMTLAVCPTCGFIANIDFDSNLTHYDARYEATQGYSPTFNAFHKRLAQDLIDRFDLHDKTVIEIGCDKGDFLTMLCEMGPNTGVGFDPAYVPGRHPSPAAARLTFIPDFYSQKYAEFDADFFVCKMTLEHISETAVFMQTIREAIGNRLDTTLFFQIPNASYILNDQAFWDVYYEHCSYFTKGSLTHLFQSAGFAVMSVWTDYDDQYLMISARPAAQTSSLLPLPEDLAETMAAVEKFAADIPYKIGNWQDKIETLLADGKKVTLWGGGSKAVAFLTTLGFGVNKIPYVIDINPNKTGTFLAGCGQVVVAPDYLPGDPPDVVIIMNPVYRQEIRHSLQKSGLDPMIMTVDEA
ncbi:MAG: methyltransferase domain-containing protein [Anaerolineae bacterium]|nr:methyltransferase domain-containing protein [Anaerolineae bacterium]